MSELNPGLDGGSLVRRRHAAADALGRHLFGAALQHGIHAWRRSLLTKNLLMLLLCAPIHGICALLCARDARFFDLVLLWARTRLPASFANLRLWKASSYSPLAIDLPRIAADAGGSSRSMWCVPRAPRRHR